MEFLENIDLINVVFRLLAVFAIIVVGRWLASNSRKWLLASLKKTELTESLNTLIITLAYYTVLILTFVIALAVLGVPATALVGGLGLIIVVLAIALQASLGNLAATVNFLLFKPFEVGDLILTAGVMGMVQEIQIFSTVLLSADRKTHILPNGKIQATGLTNLSKVGTLRVDLAFNISYDSNVDQAKEILEKILTEDEDVLQEPAPQVFVQKLNDSGLEIAAWPFVEIANYLAFQTTITERVKKSFDEAGIITPYPQQDVHLVSQSD
ncbi:MAG: mechanosensitive ion channel family protein [Chloroflexi bacterium]|nr:mechanosensitive ion channel family protein [Chloroflexota bacterium]